MLWKKPKPTKEQQFPFRVEKEGEHHMDSKYALLILSAHMECKLSSEEDRKVFNILFLLIDKTMWRN